MQNNDMIPERQRPDDHTRYKQTLHSNPYRCTVLGINASRIRLLGDSVNRSASLQPPFLETNRDQRQR